MQDLEISSRSLLYNINPLDIGTPYVESLTSYISRLAIYHCVSTGTLISKFLSPYLNKFYILQIAKRGGNGFYDSSNGINGIGSQAVDFINVLKSLNYREDLIKMTFNFWSNVFSTRGLLRTEKAWCGVCYEESKIKNEPIFDQLVWCLKEVTFCLKHKTLLTTECQNCSKTMQIISRTTIPGYCQHCLAWLGVKDPLVNLDLGEKDIQVSVLIGDMVAYSSSENCRVFSENIVGESLKKVSENLFDGKIGEMSRFLSIPETTLRYWVKGLNLAALPNVIDICLKLNISVLQFLGIEKFPSNVSLQKDSLNNLGPIYRKKYDYVQIKRILDREIESNNPKSLKKVAELIGCDRKLLYKKFPVETEKIVRNYQKYVENQKVNRRNTIQTELENAVHQLCSQGEYPSRRKVELFLDNKYFVKESFIWEQLNNIKTEYSEDNS